MSYKQRNITLLAVMVALIGIIYGYFVFFEYPEKIEMAMQKAEQLEKQVSPLRGIEEQFEPNKRLLEEKEAKLAQSEKRVTLKISPTDTYRYLNQIMEYVGFLKFDIIFTGNKSKSRYGYHTYYIKGEGSFQKLFQFIWYIERGPELYKIGKLHLQGVETVKVEDARHDLVIPFDMELRAFFAKVKLKELPYIHRTLNQVKIPRASNPFYPHVLQKLPPNREKLIEVERSTLKAIFADRILLEDAEGKMHILREGAQVYLGYLLKIHPKDNQVVFRLNKGGIVEQVVLTLSFGETEN